MYVYIKFVIFNIILKFVYTCSANNLFTLCAGVVASVSFTISDLAGLAFV